MLGVDGGGTSTVAWLAGRSGEVVGRGKAAGSNQKVVGPEMARHMIGRAIDGAFENAGIERKQVDAICLGLAGSGRVEDRVLVKSWVLQEGWGQRALVVNDAELVVHAGLGADEGVALICGTGSIAMGQAWDGRKVRVGGLGPILGDEGSAWHVATEALKLVAVRLDGQAESPEDDPLAEAMLRALGAESLPELIRAVYDPRSDRASIASLAPIAVEAIDRVTDEEAWDHVVSSPAWGLCGLLSAARRKLEPDTDSLVVALAGGFILNCQLYREQLERHLQIWPQVKVEIRTVPEPVSGAIGLARRLLD